MSEDLNRAEDCETPEPVTHDLRNSSMFTFHSDGTVTAKIPPVRVIELNDRVIIDNPFR